MLVDRGGRGARLAARRASGPPAGLLVVLGAACAPAAYYAVLERTDAAWELAGQVNAAGNQATWSWPWWAIVLTLAPLARARRARLPDARRDAGRTSPRACGRSRRWRSTSRPSARSRTTRSRAWRSRSRCSRCRASGRSGRARPPGLVVACARAARRARHRRTASRSRSTRSAPPATRTSSSRASRTALDVLERRPAARRRARAGLRRPHAPVPDRARGLRRRAVVDAGLGRARARDARAVRGRHGRRRRRRRSRAAPARGSRSWTAGRGCATCGPCSATRSRACARSAARPSTSCGREAPVAPVRRGRARRASPRRSSGSSPTTRG